eukprot:8658989-Heterocapsa_arctica.AAC.1
MPRPRGLRWPRAPRRSRSRCPPPPMTSCTGRTARRGCPASIRRSRLAGSATRGRGRTGGRRPRRAR